MLSSNQSFYRVIADYMRGVGDHRVGWWWKEVMGQQNSCKTLIGVHLMQKIKYSYWTPPFTSLLKYINSFSMRFVYFSSWVHSRRSDYLCKHHIHDVHFLYMYENYTACTMHMYTNVVVYVKMIKLWSRNERWKVINKVVKTKYQMWLPMYMYMHIYMYKYFYSACNAYVADSSKCRKCKCRKNLYLFTVTTLCISKDLHTRILTYMYMYKYKYIYSPNKEGGGKHRIRTCTIM